jgi:hypothetical protein
MMVKRSDPEAVVLWRETKGRHAPAEQVVAHAIQGDTTLCGEPAKSAPWADTGRGVRCPACMRVFDSAPLGSEEICAAVGISYRQLDSWTRRGFIQSAGDPQPGSGNRRRWPMEEVAVAQAMHVLVNMDGGGLTPEAAARAARNHGVLAPGVVVMVNRDDVHLAGPAEFTIGTQSAGSVHPVEVHTTETPEG